MKAEMEPVSNIGFGVGWTSMVSSSSFDVGSAMVLVSLSDFYVDSI